MEEDYKIYLAQKRFKPTTVASFCGINLMQDIWVPGVLADYFFAKNHSSPTLEIKFSFSIVKYRVYEFLCNWSKYWNINRTSHLVMAKSGLHQKLK